MILSELILAISNAEFPIYKYLIVQSKIPNCTHLSPLTFLMESIVSFDLKPTIVILEEFAVEGLYFSLIGPFWYCVVVQ